jgi:hypothetical protein
MNRSQIEKVEDKGEGIWLINGVIEIDVSKINLENPDYSKITNSTTANAIRAVLDPDCDIELTSWIEPVVEYDAEKIIRELRPLVEKYQMSDVDPRIDNNFFAAIIAPYGERRTLGQINPVSCPKCEENFQWVNTLWNVVWEDIKVKIRAEQEYSIDFTALMVEVGQTANPRNKYDECYTEYLTALST